MNNLANESFNFFLNLGISRDKRCKKRAFDLYDSMDEDEQDEESKAR